jgi:nitrite reductase (NADH) small subunit
MKSNDTTWEAWSRFRRARGDGAVYATQARCPHKQGPLADGIVGGETVVCPYHAWKFHLGTGGGLPTNPGAGCLRVYPVSVDGDGSVWLTVEPAPADISVAACA